MQHYSFSEINGFKAVHTTYGLGVTHLTDFHLDERPMEKSRLGATLKQYFKSTFFWFTSCAPSQHTLSSHVERFFFFGFLRKSSERINKIMSAKLF